MKNYENKLLVASVHCTTTTYYTPGCRPNNKSKKKNLKISSNGGGNAYKSTDGR